VNSGALCRRVPPRASRGTDVSDDFDLRHLVLVVRLAREWNEQTHAGQCSRLPREGPRAGLSSSGTVIDGVVEPEGIPSLLAGGELDWSGRPVS
jgi:hypothetical protein